jgi:hypothetical protein
MCNLMEIWPDSGENRTSIRQGGEIPVPEAKPGGENFGPVIRGHKARDHHHVARRGSGRD